MTNNEITEAYFVARGGGMKLQNILEHYPDFKREVLEVMEGDGFYPTINKKKLGGLYFVWDNSWMKSTPFLEELIKDNEILRAGVISATKYWSNKK